MAKQTINIGSAANDGTGSTLREAFDITNDNFTELYGGTGGLLHKIEGTNFTGSLLIGHSTTGTLSSALNNTGVGINSLKSITSGDANVGLGTRSGFNLTSGLGNILIGNRTGENIIDGSYNVAIGDEALFTENGHGKNIAIGYHALRAQDAGADAFNIAIGHTAGQHITTGIRNTVVGGLAGDALTQGIRNTAIGYLALSGEDTGNRNTAIGHAALNSLNFSGDGHNVAIGNDAGVSINTGVQNTILGSDAGDAVTTGSNNIIIGYDAAASAVDVSNEVTIGNSSIANVRIPADSTLKIGASGDLQLEHLSSNSFIKNTAVGDLYIENQVDDADVIFRSDNGAGGLSAYITLDGSNVRTQIDREMRFMDTIPAKFGTGGDLQISHDATDSYIQNATGNLKIFQNANNKDITFYNDDGSGGTTAYFFLDGSLASSGTVYTVFPDNSRAIFGSGYDLQIYHDASNSYIKQSGTGHLIIQQEVDDGDIAFKSDDGSGGVTEYFRVDGGTERNIFSKDSEHSDNVSAYFGSGNNMRILYNGTHGFISQNNGGDLRIITNVDDGDILFQSDDGSGGVQTYFFLDGSRADGTYVYTEFPDNSVIGLGNDTDLQIYHTGTNSMIDNFVGDLVIQQRNDDGDIKFSCDDGSGGLTEYFRLDGGTTSMVASKNITFLDGLRATFGSGADMQIYHNSTNTLIENNTGNLEIINNTDNGDISFKSDDGSGGTTEYFRVDGGSENIQFPKSLFLYDNVFLNIGGNFDLRLYHDGNSNIKAQGSGNLIISQTVDDADISFQCDNGSGSLAEYFRLDGSSVQTIVEKDFRFIDNVKAILGTGSDLEMYHNATDSAIQNNTGDLYISNFQDDGDIIFRSDDGSGGHTQYFKLEGANTRTTFAKNAIWSDNVKVQFGSSVDYEIYHDGTDTQHRNFVGDLLIKQEADDKDIIFSSDDGSGGVATYFKLDGSSASSGTLYTQFPDNSNLTFGSADDLQIKHDGTDSKITNTNGDLYIRSTADDKDIIFQSDDGGGSTATYFSLDGSEVRCLFSVNAEFSDNVKAKFGTSDDLQIFHDGSNSRINETGTGNLIIQATNYQLLKGDGGEFIMQGIADAEVSLYHNGSKKFETTSTGALVTGDLEIANSSDGIILESPNGTRYRVTVDNSGNLSTAAL